MSEIAGLCIGAGQEQCHAIQVAQTLGIKVVAVDVNPNAAGKDIADVFYCADIHDAQKIINISEQHKIQLTLPVPIGAAILTQGIVNDYFGLEGVTRKAAEWCSDKLRFQQLLTGLAVCQRKQKVIGEVEQLKSLPLPFIVKPNKGSGSRGVLLLSSEQDVSRFIKHHDPCNYPDLMLVEEYIDGQPLGVDGYIVGGEVKIALVREKFLTVPPYRVEVAHLAIKLSQHLIDCIQQTLQKVVNVLQLKNAVIHADMICPSPSSQDGLYLIEMSPRPSGAHISERLIPHSTGQNFISDAIQLFLHSGLPDFSPKTIKPAILGFLDFPSGSLTEDIGALFDGIETMEKCTLKNKGDRVHQTKTLHDLLDNGYFILRADNKSMLISNYSRIMKAVSSAVA